MSWSPGKCMEHFNTRFGPNYQSVCAVTAGHPQQALCVFYADISWGLVKPADLRSRLQQHGLRAGKGRRAVHRSYCMSHGCNLVVRVAFCRLKIWAFIKNFGWKILLLQIIIYEHKASKCQIWAAWTRKSWSFSWWTCATVRWIHEKSVVQEWGAAWLPDKCEAAVLLPDGDDPGRYQPFPPPGLSGTCSVVMHATRLLMPRLCLWCHQSLMRPRRHHTLTWSLCLWPSL